MTTAPRTEYFMYPCLYHLPRVCRTLVPEIRVRSEIFRNIDVLMGVIYD